MKTYPGGKCPWALRCCHGLLQELGVVATFKLGEVVVILRACRETMHHVPLPFITKEHGWQQNHQTRHKDPIWVDRGAKLVVSQACASFANRMLRFNGLHLLVFLSYAYMWLWMLGCCNLHGHQGHKTQPPPQLALLSSSMSLVTSTIGWSSSCWQVPLDPHPRK